MDILKRALSPKKYQQLNEQLLRAIESSIRFKLLPHDSQFVFKFFTNRKTINWLILAGIDIQDFHDYVSYPAEINTINAHNILKQIRDNEQKTISID